MVFTRGVIEDVCSCFIHECVYSMDLILVLWGGNLIKVVSQAGLSRLFGVLLVLCWRVLLRVKVCVRIRLILTGVNGLGGFNVLETMYDEILNVFVEDLLSL